MSLRLVGIARFPRDLLALCVDETTRGRFTLEGARRCGKLEASALRMP